MFGLDILEVAIGLAFVYLLFSTFCSALVEAVELKVKKRKQLLLDGIGALLEAEDIRTAFREHPLIKAMNKGCVLPEPVSKQANKTNPELGPSYIPGRTFVATVLNVTLAGKTIDTAVGAGSDQYNFTQVRNALADNEDKVSKALVALFDQAGNSLEQAKKNVEQWFDDAMDRISGEFKRHAIAINVCFAIVLVLVANADSIVIARHLWQDDAARKALVAQWEAYTEAEKKEEAAKEKAKNLAPPERKQGASEGGAAGPVKSEQNQVVDEMGDVPPGAEQKQEAAEGGAAVPAKSEPSQDGGGAGNAPTVTAPDQGSAGGGDKEPNNSKQDQGGNSDKANNPALAEESANAELIDQLLREIDATNLPLGWSAESVPVKKVMEQQKQEETKKGSKLTLCEKVGLWWVYVFNKFIGLGLTVLALSLGAPFWVEMLNKLNSFRVSGVAPKDLEDREKLAAKLAAKG